MLLFLSEVGTGTHNSPWLQIILSIIALFGLFVSAFYGYKGAVAAKTAAIQSTQANEAVNHRGKGEDKLVDIVSHIRDRINVLDDWKSRWDSLPESIGSAQKLSEHLTVIDHKIDNSTSTLSTRVTQLEEENAPRHDSILHLVELLIQKVNQHVEWEEEQKYHELEEAVKSLEVKRGRPRKGNT